MSSLPPRFGARGNGETLCTIKRLFGLLIKDFFPSLQGVGWDNMAFVFLNRYLDLSEVGY